jgi:2-dehydropantoate 2-reductase
VLGALANTSGELLPSGEVLFTRNVNVSIGELAGGDSSRAQNIAALIAASGVRSIAVPNVVAREWTKFVGWIGLMSMSVTTRAITGTYLSDPDCALLLVRLVREMSALATASGVELTDQPSLLPIQTIIRRPEQEAVAAVMQSGNEFKASAPEHRMSSLQDLIAGRPLEVEETLGDALQRAKKVGISMPLLETCYRLVAAIDRTAQQTRS